MTARGEHDRLVGREVDVIAERTLRSRTATAPARVSTAAVVVHGDNPQRGRDASGRVDASAADGRSRAGAPASSRDLWASMLETAALDPMLEYLVTIAAAAVGGVDDVSASVYPGGAAPVVATSAGVGDVDRLQFGPGGGPCVEAVRTGQRQNAALDGARPRWPAFAAAAVGAGFRHVLAVPLAAEGKPIGSLVLYSRREGAFGPEEVTAAEEVARRAALVLRNAIALTRSQHANDNLREGMATRGVIGQAQGILMSRHACTGTEAFAMLRSASQTSNRPLRDVAADLVADHERDVGAS